MESLSEGQLGRIEAASKRDDDMKLLRTHDGSLYVETDQDLSDTLDDPHLSVQLLDPHLLADAALERPGDVADRTLAIMFGGCALVTLQALLFGLPLYYWPLPHAARVVVLCLACNGFVGFYALMVVLRNADNWLHSAAALLGWALSLTGVLGSAAALADNAAPFVLLAMLWAQNMTAAACVRSGMRVRWKVAALLLGATLFMWCINIVTYVSRHDWGAAVAVLLVAVGCVGYAAWQLRRSEMRYSLTWRDAARSVLLYHGDPAVMAWERVFANSIVSS